MFTIDNDGIFKEILPNNGKYSKCYKSIIVLFTNKEVVTTWSPKDFYEKLKEADFDMDFQIKMLYAHCKVRKPKI